MAIDIEVPTLGESVTEATVGHWFKGVGDAVAADEPLVELETDKVTVEVRAPTAGVLAAISAEQGATVAVGAVLGSISADPAAASKPAPPPPVAGKTGAAAARAEAPSGPGPRPVAGDLAPPPPPAARKLMEETGLTAADVTGSGRRGQILKADVAAGSRPSAAVSYRTPAAARVEPMRPPSVANDRVREERVPMTRLRQTIARRLKDAQNTAAMLTTFNDVDMSAIMAMRSTYKDAFEKRHGVKLGFMGFFVKASVQSLREIPAINAEIDGEDIVYKNYYHIGVAVGTDRGLVVPVVREADHMSLAEIEQKIADFSGRARAGKLTIEEMQGGTFTISNGGVYGSLLSTPILNAPQSGVLGMHRIEERPVVRNGQIVARPMMNLALSYDHRLVDGKDAVSFLVRVKEYLEDPQRFLLEL